MICIFELVARSLLESKYEASHVDVSAANAGQHAMEMQKES